MKGILTQRFTSARGESFPIIYRGNDKESYENHTTGANTQRQGSLSYTGGTPVPLSNRVTQKDLSRGGCGARGLWVNLGEPGNLQ